MKKTFIVAAILAATCGGATMQASAADVFVTVAPPPPRVEHVPALRHGHVWVPGHWDWRGRRYVWVDGTMVRERRGYRYAEPRWVERGGRWYQKRGRWARGDYDRDGVPNRYDSAPNNARRY
jgi:hypothetical protein